MCIVLCGVRCCVVCLSVCPHLHMWFLGVCKLGFSAILVSALGRDRWVVLIQSVSVYFGIFCFVYAIR